MKLLVQITIESRPDGLYIKCGHKEAGPFKDIHNILEYVKNWMDSRIIYRKVSVDKLRVIVDKEVPP